jgi:hypothetical protein
METACWVNPKRSGCALVVYWQNAALIGSRQEIADTQTVARQLRKAAENRIRE